STGPACQPPACSAGGHQAAPAAPLSEPAAVSLTMRSNRFPSTEPKVAGGTALLGFARAAYPAASSDDPAPCACTIHLSKSPGSTAFTVKRISAKPSPLKLAEMPGYSPGRSASRFRCVAIPDIA